MAIRQLKYDGDSILRKRSKEVEVVDDKIRELLDDMDETMHANNGVGLSAVQVGILKRVIVIDINYDGTPSIKLVNPEIVKEKGIQEVQEGCLSFPNQFAQVSRPNKVEVKGLNENGEMVRIKAEGLLAQALCHEIDHLNGKLFIDIMKEGTLEYLTNEDMKKEE